MNPSSRHDQNSLLGPFSQSTFNEKSWKTIQTKLSKLKQVSLQNELLPECLQYLQLLQDINTCPNTTEYFGIPSIKAFFFNEFIPRTTENILKCKTMDNEKITEILKPCLVQVVLLWLKTLLDNQTELTKAAEQVLKAAYSYYNCVVLQAVPMKPDRNDDNAPSSKKGLRSTLFDDFVERLRKEKVPECIREIMNNTKSWASNITKMTIVCSAVANLGFVLPEGSAGGYMSGFREVIKERLFCDVELHKDSFTEENTRDLLEVYGLLLRRLTYSSQEKHIEVDLLRLQISLICLRSDTQSTKFMGLRMVKQVIVDLEAAQSKTEIVSECNKLMHTLFHEIYRDEKTWKSALRDSLVLLRYMLEQKLLNSGDFKPLKVALSLLGKCETQMKQMIFYKVKDIQTYLLVLDCMIPMASSDFGALDKNMIDLFTTLYSLAGYQSQVGKRLADFYWNVLVNSEEITDSSLLSKILLQKEHLSGGNSIEFTIETINSCIDQLETDVLKFPLFRIIGLIMIQTIGKLNSAKCESLRKVLVERKVLNLFCDHIKSFKMTNQVINDSLFYETQISMRMECLSNIVGNPGKTLPLTYEILNELWEMHVDQAFIAVERDLFFKTLSSIIHLQGFQANDDLLRFFKEKVISEKAQRQLQQSKEGAICFQNFFLAVNQSLENIWVVQDSSDFVVKVHPEKLEGFEGLWSFIMSCEDQDIVDGASNFLFRIYASIEDQFEQELAGIREKYIARCFKYVKEGQKERLIRCLRLISMMMDASETRGIGNMTVHSQLIKSEQLNVSIGFGLRSKVTVTIDSNSTLFELLSEITKQIRVYRKLKHPIFSKGELTWEEIALHRPLSPQEEITNTYNGRTLADIGININTRLTVNMKTIPKAHLLRSPNELSWRAVNLFNGLFEHYSENGKMSPENYLAFVNPQIRYAYAYGTHDAVRDFFKSWDTDRDGYLTLEDFLAFYLEASKERPFLIWSTLEALRKRNDLREVDDIDNFKVNESSLVSNIISSNSGYFEMLFSLLDYEENTVAEEAWKLLNRMPTNLQMLEDLVLIEGVKGGNWNSLINLNSKYKVLYALNIVEYLMYFNENNKKVTLIKDPKLEETLKRWERDFIEYGGLDHLCRVFELFKPIEDNVVSYKRVYQFAKAMSEKFIPGCDDVYNADETTRSKISVFIKTVSEYQDAYLLNEKLHEKIDIRKK